MGLSLDRRSLQPAPISHKNTAGSPRTSPPAYLIIVEWAEDGAAAAETDTERERWNERRPVLLLIKLGNKPENTAAY